MRMYLLAALVLAGICFTTSLVASPEPPGFPSENVTLLSQVSLADFGNPSNGSDCWGYTAPSGREYALMGLYNSMSVVEITNPSSPSIIGSVSHSNSLWADIKVYEDVAYVSNESGGGVDVVDLSQVDDGIVTLVQRLTIGGLSSVHNLAIDTQSGFLYLCGGNINGGRIVAYDLSDPQYPTLAGQASSGASMHDAQVWTYRSGPFTNRQILFGAAGGSGLHIVDVTNKSNMFTVSQASYPGQSYCHQCWLSEDSQILYVNDETDGIAETRVFDVSDIENPDLLNTFGWGVNSIDHNLYVKGNYIYEANYTSGLRVFDTSEDPIDPTMIGYFDTYPSNDAQSYDGLWSCFPYFESGIVIGSDIQSGLFVWRIELSLISIANADQPEMISSQGAALGVDIVEDEPGGLEPGSARLVYDAGDGFVEVDMTSVGGMRWEGSVDPGECGSVLSYYFQAEDANGMVSTLPSGAPSSVYMTLVADASTVAFEDDCETDQGWVVQNSAGLEDGAWSRGIPAGGGDRGDPPTDYDGSGQCYLTDNVDGNSDVDGGATTLISPAMDVTAPGAQLSYARWYSNSFGAAPASDIFEVEVNSGGSAWVTLEVVGPSGSEVNGGWYEKTWLVSDMEGITPTTTFRVRFTVSDLGDGSVIEAAVDAIAVTAYECDDGSIDGDVDGNGAVDFQDLVALLSSWGPCSPGGECPADFDGNGAVDFSDLLILLGSWS